MLSIPVSQLIFSHVTSLNYANRSIIDTSGTMTQFRWNYPCSVVHNQINHTSYLVEDSLSSRIIKIVHAQVPHERDQISVWGIMTNLSLGHLLLVPERHRTRQYYLIASSRREIYSFSEDGRRTHLAGAPSGSAQYANGHGPESRFAKIDAIAMDSLGRLLIADSNNHCIRRLTVNDTRDTIVTTMAGSTRIGFLDHVDPLLAEFRFPGGICMDPQDNCFVSDTGNHRIRRIDSITGLVTTIVASGEMSITPAIGYDHHDPPTVFLSSPRQIVYEHTNNGLFVLDSNSNRIQFVSLMNGQLITVAGTTMNGYVDGPGHQAIFKDIGGIALEKIEPLPGWISDVAAHPPFLTWPPGLFDIIDSYIPRTILLLVADYFNGTVRRVELVIS